MMIEMGQEVDCFVGLKLTDRYMRLFYRYTVDLDLESTIHAV